ncbi:hypothetical protein E3Q09_00641 [Wallemia mellicola]|nr:hypothetical protein E3Q09_00641 [Wallemia mellicola]
MASRAARIALSYPSRQFTTSTVAHLPPKKGQTIKKTANSFTKKNKGGNKLKTEAVSHSGRYEKLQATPPDLSFMPEFLPERITDKSIGTPFRFTKDALNITKFTGIPPTLAREFATEREAHTVIRKSSINAINKLDSASKTSSKDNRYVLHGKIGSGRSISLLQSVIYAQQSNWLVFYIPKSQHLVDSSYAYNPPSESGGIWTQPSLSAEILRIFAETNKEKLNDVKISQDYDQFKAGDKIYDLCIHATKYENKAVETFDVVMNELSKQTAHPVLLAMDSIQAMYQPTLYKDQHFNKLHPYELSVTAKILDFLSGRQQFNRGAILGATSSTPTTMQIPSLLLAQLGLQPEKPINPFEKWNTKHLNNANGLKLIEMEELTFAEAVGVFESFAKKVSTGVNENGDKSIDENKEKSPHKSYDGKKMMEWFIAGGASGVASRTAVSPIERLKILQQVQSFSKAEYTGLWSSLKKMYKEEGFKGFMRGNGINCLRIAPYSAVQFSTYEFLKILFAGDSNRPLENWQKLAAGALAGINSVATTYPLDLVRSRLSIATASLGVESSRQDAKLSMWAMGKKVYREEGGYRGLYRGLVPTSVGVAPYVAINFATYEMLKSYIPIDGSKWLALVIGAMSGTVSQTLTYPCDVLRRKMQVNGIRSDALGPKYNGSIDAIKQIVRAEGFKGLYRGIVANWMKVAPSIGVSFYTYELCSSMNDNSKIYISNLSWSTNDEDLARAFSPFGQISDYIVMKDRQTGRSRGFGFVTYANDREASSALESMNEVELENTRQLRTRPVITKKIVS